MMRVAVSAFRKANETAGVAAVNVLLLCILLQSHNFVVNVDGHQ
jgi:hypothetical protein